MEGKSSASMSRIKIKLLMFVKNIANERSFLSDIFIIVGGKNKIFFLLPTHISNC
jgi:hypothetical protein